MNELMQMDPKERRSYSRWPTSAEAWVDLGGTSVPIPCRLSEISLQGARIIIDPSMELPESFFLKFGRTMHRAEVVWRRKNCLGVRFKDPGSSGLF